jgi:protein tyrosine/serine phosphatase
LAYPAQALPKDASDVVAASAPRLDIFNFGQISPTYFRGGELKNDSASALAARGVKTVIDLRSDKDVKSAEAKLVADAGMKYVRIPMSTRVAPTTEQISEFLSLVTNPANQPVYVHCVEGRHRTGVMTAVYRMTVDGWTADRAFDEMKDFKFGFDFLHPEFKKFVFRYEPVTPEISTPAATTIASDAPAADGATGDAAEAPERDGKVLVPAAAVKGADAATVAN